MAIEWYFVEARERCGPYDAGELQELVTAGRVGPETLVWRTGQGDWKPFRELAGELEAAAGPAPASPVPAGMVRCPNCRCVVRPDELLPTATGQVCPNCKLDYLQRVREGAAQPRPARLLGVGEPRPNAQVTAAAREALRGRWRAPLLGYLVIFLLNLIVGAVGIPAQAVPLLPQIINLLALGPLELGIAMLFLEFWRHRDAEAGLVFGGYRRYGKAIGTLVLRNLGIMGAAFLCALPALLLMGADAASRGLPEGSTALSVLAFLFLLPAVAVAVYLYLHWSMAFYLLADQPEAGAAAVLADSGRRMKGHKKQLFLLYLRFLGWAVLVLLPAALGAALTLPLIVIGAGLSMIGFLFLAVYVQVSVTIFYDDLVGGQEETGPVQE